MSRPNPEDLLLSLLSEVGYTDTTLPEEPWDDIEFPIILVDRNPEVGGITKHGDTDRAQMVIAALHETRDQAFEALDRCRELIINDDMPQEVDGYLIEPCEEVGAPGEEKDVNPRFRAVTAVFWVPISLRY